MTIRLYGIPNCDQVKRARAWFAARQLAVEFVDFKKTPPDAVLLGRWLRQVPADTLVNRAGTTWRKLDESERARAARTDGAVALMIAHPSIIRRPVIEHAHTLVVGFDAERYERTFHA